MNNLIADVVIIGGGVIGTSIAYNLAKQKVKVVLIEKNNLASGSSGACDGLILMQSKKPGVHLKLAMASRTLFERLNNELLFPITYRNTGGMVVVEDEGELNAVRMFVKEQKKIGLNVALLHTHEARELEPHLSEKIQGATYSALDGQVNPINLTLSFGLGAKKHGAKIICNTSVRRIRNAKAKVESVEIDKETIKTGIVVNAAGVFAPEIGRMVGLKIPIKPRRGQILVTESTDNILKHCLISAKYISGKFSSYSVNTEGVSIEQTTNGNLLLGSTREFVGFDKRTTMRGLKKISKNACQLIPQIKELNIIRTFSGLRPCTPDGLPILGTVNSVRGFLMAAGHEGDGISLAPITGELISQLILTGRTVIPLDDFRLERFQPEGSNKGVIDGKLTD